jgi:3',5'-cyclic AMP phosphodiesterase CpdA
MGLVRTVLILALTAPLLAQQPQGTAAAPPPASIVLDVARPVAPPKHPLPPEARTASQTRFSFIIYGDTRATSAVQNEQPYPVHDEVIATILATVKARAHTHYPVRFVLQTGDAVFAAASGRMWNASFTPALERLTRGADLPYFLTAGNHDVTGLPEGNPRRAQALNNTLSAMSRLIPPEGSPRRLNGYLTYAFGYGNVFVLAIDSNVASDALQLAWVTDQLDHLDRRRYPIVVAFMHHPPYSSGPHGFARVEAATLAVRERYMPLFRRHHVRLIAAGHEHFFDQWVEHYEDGGKTYRMDTIVTGGGGAPTYTYRGEPDLRAYLTAGAAQQVRVDHVAKPGATIADNPHHFIVITVDGDRLSEEIVASGNAPFAPFGGKSTIDLAD